MNGAEETRLAKTNAVRNALTVSLLACAIGVTAVVAPETFKGDLALAAPPARLQAGKAKFTPAQNPGAQPVKLQEFARADSGVKLLVGIFNRLGREPQLAQKSDKKNSLLAAKQMYDASRENASQFASSQAANFAGVSNINSGNTDPALAIRPRAVARPKPSDKMIAITGVSIAMAPAKKQYKAEAKEEREDKASSLKESDRAQPAQAELSRRADMDDSRPATRSRDEHSVKVITGPSSNLALGQNRGYIQEFGGAAASGAGQSRKLASQGWYKTQSSADIASEPSGIIRPTEQPGLFKYVREHKKDLPKDAPAIAMLPSQAAPASPANNSAGALNVPPPPSSNSSFAQSASQAGLADRADSALDNFAAKNAVAARAKAKSREAGIGGNSSANSDARQSIVSENEIGLESSEGAPLQVAFLPPSTVHGINGLPLGASENETANFFKNRGNLAKTVIAGWKVWTVFDHQQNPLIQVYLRNGRTEAFRIFSQSYVPAGLGVSIADELPSMKGKFGEPSFILEEPGVRGLGGAMAKNYVYPVSQVSFQLVRSGPRSPQILSLLLFRYL